MIEALFEIIIKSDAFTQYYKQGHEGIAPTKFQIHDEAVEHVIK
jgi:hypothetical protein